MDRAKDISRRPPGSKRTLLLAAVGAIAGLSIAGAGLFTAKGSRSSVVPAEAVAIVNGTQILKIDFDAQLIALYGLKTASEANADQRKRVLDDMIREELFVQRGVEIDMASVDTDVRAALVNSVEQQLASDMLSRQPTEEQLREFYEAHQDKYLTEGRLLVRDLVGRGLSKERAAEAVRALRDGMSIVDAVARFGLSESGKVNGEEFYFAAKIHLGDPLFSVARTLVGGQISDPVSALDGLHILLVERNHVPTLRNFREARPSVLQEFAGSVGWSVATWRISLSAQASGYSDFAGVWKVDLYD